MKARHAVLGGFAAAAMLGILGTSAPAKAADIAQVFDILGKSRTGQELTRRGVQNLGNGSFSGLVARVRFGSVGHTTAELHRSFSHGATSLENVITITIPEKSVLAESALVLAHELCHATNLPKVDPYASNLGLDGYLRERIDGPGGEVRAIQTACTVANELVDAGYLGSDRRCASELGETNQLRTQLFRVGSYLGDLNRALGSDGRSLGLSPEEPYFVAVTHGVPYPEAVRRDFAAMTQAACANTRTHLRDLESESSPDWQEIVRSRNLIERRCDQTTVSSNANALERSSS